MAKPVTDINDPRYLKAVGHPLRVRILAMLDEETHSPVQLADKLGASLGTVSYHVRTLHGLGLIKLVGRTPRRGAIEHHYRAHERPKASEASWAEAGPVVKQALIGATLQEVAEVASASNASGGFDRSDAQLVRTAVSLDAKGFQDLSSAVLKLVGEVEKIEAAAAKRIAAADGEAAAVDAGVVLMLFEAARLSDQRAPAPVAAAKSA